MDPRRLSIILPAWNGARFLRPQLDSILAQTDADFELLAIDDGSTDETVAILDEYARRDTRMRRLHSQGNKGQTARLIELLGESRGEFIAIADQDDIWALDRNAKLLAAIGDRAMALGRSQLIDGEGADLGRSLLESYSVDASRVGPLSALFLPLVSAHASIFRRDWVALGAFFGFLPFDHALGLEAMFSKGLIYCDDAVVQHRLHGGNQLNGSVSQVAERRLLSPYLARQAFGFLPPARLTFAQRLDQLGRSAALDTETRGQFRYLAGKSWHIWFGAGTEQRGLETEFRERLGQYASSSEDLDFFTRNIAALTRRLLSPTNLGIALDMLVRDRNRLAHNSVA